MSIINDAGVQISAEKYIDHYRTRCELASIMYNANFKQSSESGKTIKDLMLAGF